MRKVFSETRCRCGVWRTGGEACIGVEFHNGRIPVLVRGTDYAGNYHTWALVRYCWQIRGEKSLVRASWPIYAFVPQTIRITTSREEKKEKKVVNKPKTHHITTEQIPLV